MSGDAKAVLKEARKTRSVQQAREWLKSLPSQPPGCRACDDDRWLYLAGISTNLRWWSSAVMCVHCSPGRERDARLSKDAKDLAAAERNQGAYADGPRRLRQTLKIERSGLASGWADSGRPLLTARQERMLRWTYIRARKAMGNEPPRSLGTIYEALERLNWPPAGLDARQVRSIVDEILRRREAGIEAWHPSRSVDQAVSDPVVDDQGELKF